MLRRLTVALSAAIALFASPASTQAEELPEPPALYPDVVSDLGGRPVHGHLSERRSTQDGRVRIDGNGDQPRRFVTARPEALDDPLAAASQLTEGRPFEVPPALFHGSGAPGAQASHVALCDPYLASDLPRNPFACTYKGGAADCYDVSVVQVVHAPRGDSTVRSEIWSTPVRITVRRPKTRHAQVASVERLAEPRVSPIKRSPARSSNLLLEPVVSGDGRLIFLNAGDTLVYSVMADTESPCDARNWTRLEHISRMNGDPQMQRYGIAQYPLRDTENRVIRAGRPVRGAYPWIDRRAKNLFFTQVQGAGFFYRDEAGRIQTRYELLDRPPRREIETEAATRFATSWAGLWSEGKILVPDNRVNNIDHHLGKRSYRPRARLYSDDADGVQLARATVTSINSPENEWNYRSQVRSRSPRDVVWWLSGSNGMTDEVIFDDALDLGTLIFSPMNASVDNRARQWRDGFDYRRFTGYTKAPRIQNAAASEQHWDLPRFGKLSGARVEPIAAGGVRGKGLWLDGSAGRLDYTIPDQGSSNDRMASETWTTSLWVDAREAGRRQRLLAFPDGSWVDLEADRVTLGDSSGETAVLLPTSLRPRAGRWVHLAWLSEPGRITLYVDGFRLASVDGAWLRVAPGRLRVGQAEGSQPVGFRGWIDELRVASGERSPEQLCNWAGGTLAGLDGVGAPADFEAAGAYPAESHDEISSRLAAAGRPGYPRYTCERKRDATHTCLASIHDTRNQDPHCVRAGLLFPEGPLFHDRPRPDSRSNPFCLTCHSLTHDTPRLRTFGPLRAGSDDTPLVEDPRRQPFQAPRRLHGVVPRGLVGNEAAMEAPREGVLLDRWLYPSLGPPTPQPD